MNSRWSREPRLLDGKSVVARITPNDIRLLGLLAKYRYLQSDDIHAQLGGSLRYLIDRLDLLYRKPNQFINRPVQQRETANANYRPMVYELDTRGATALRELGHAVPAKTYHYNFAHELMVCRILASIELGAREAAARLIEWPEIYEKLPEETKVLDEPHVIKGYKRPDSKPFGIHADAYYFFAGIEADCGTEPINTSDLDRSSIHAKFLAYVEIARLKLYKTHFNFPNYFVPIITTTKTRMESMQRHLETLVKQQKIRPQEAAIFIFGTFPSLTSYAPREPANGRMFNLLAGEVK
jgi:Replication-relaxation